MKHISKAILLMTLFVVGCSNNNSGTPINHNSMLQSVFLEDSYDNIHYYAIGMEELSKPNYVPVSYSSNGVVKISLNELDDKGNIVDKYTVETDGQHTVNLTNFKINKEYTYTIDDYPLYKAESSFTSPKFTISGKIRNIDIDGVTNVRDLGGKKTVDGKTIKQGMIYRSGEWNYSNSTVPRVTEDGINTIKNQLKIKTELDLRAFSNGETGKITESVVPGVIYKNIPMGEYYLESLNAREQIKQVFELFSDVNNYPIDFHCAIGTDRTGLIGFCLDAILGLSEKEIYQDYLFSNFGHIGGKRDSGAIDANISCLNEACDSSLTLQEKAADYLIKIIDVKAEHIESIRNIMLG